jgi:hypothetical protein
MRFLFVWLFRYLDHDFEPPGLRAEDNEAGSRLSLEPMARRYE